MDRFATALIGRVCWTVLFFYPFLMLHVVVIGALDTDVTTCACCLCSPIDFGAGQRRVFLEQISRQNAAMHASLGRPRAWGRGNARSTRPIVGNLTAANAVARGGVSLSSPNQSTRGRSRGVLKVQPRAQEPAPHSLRQLLLRPGIGDASREELVSDSADRNIMENVNMRARAPPRSSHASARP